MSKTVQIRDLDDEVYAALAKRAAAVEMSVPEFLRREVARIAARPSMEEWLGRTNRRTSGATRREVLEAFDDVRGQWPDAGR